MPAVDLLADLDDEQRRAVVTESTLVAVIAGAGSGKTRVLTRRVAYRVAQGSADEAHTLVLTFTREAAGELRRRLPRLGLRGRLTAGTFHAVARGVLLQRWRDVDRRPRTIVTDRRRLVGQVAGSLAGATAPRGAELDALVGELAWATARGLGAANYESALRRAGRQPSLEPGRIARLLDAYEREKQARGVIDLDDLLGLTIAEAERDAVFADTLRWRFRHLLVDEAQDLSPLQHRFVDLLRAGRDDLYLVGDPAQAIYGFNGADPTLLVDVETRFPGVEVVRLPSNHRCTPQIVAAGAHALSIDGQTVDVHSARPHGAAVAVTSHPDEHAETLAVAAAIAAADPSLARRGEIAVLARTNAQLPAIREALSARGVPVRDPRDAAAGELAALVGEVSRLRDADDVRAWAQNALEQAHDDGAAPGRTSVERDPDAPGPGGADPTAPPPAERVARAVLEFLRSEPVGDGTAFRAWIDAHDPFGHATDGVEVLTFHAAKGREWHIVHLVGCETSLVPHRSATTNVARSEEARLLYVAATRATDVLVVHWAERRGGYQRRLSPLLAGFTSDSPQPAPPPPELAVPARRDRDVVLDRLHRWRSDLARQRDLLPEEICSDVALGAIADRQPADASELDAATGIGPFTARSLFPSLAHALAAVDTVGTADTGT